MEDVYCIRCEMLNKKTKASRKMRSPLGDLLPLCEQCIKEVREENSIFTPDTIPENE